MYLMAGGTGDKEFHSTRAKVYSNQEEAMRVLLSVADAVGDLLADQVNHGGADAVQMFDTWAGLLSESDYRRYAKPATERAIEVFRSKAKRAFLSSITRKEVHICTRKSEPSTLMQCPLIGGMISGRIALSLAHNLPSRATLTHRGCMDLQRLRKRQQNMYSVMLKRTRAYFQPRPWFFTGCSNRLCGSSVAYSHR